MSHPSVGATPNHHPIRSYRRQVREWFARCANNAPKRKGRPT
jgi:hypothetical protein